MPKNGVRDGGTGQSVSGSGVAIAALAGGAAVIASGAHKTKKTAQEPIAISVEPAALGETLTPQKASRFLSMATNGATRSAIDDLVKSGIGDWLTLQTSMPRSQSHWDWLMSAGYGGAAAQVNWAGWDNSIWRQLISAPDQLRQRVALALLDTLVVSMDGLNMFWRQMAMGSYMDVLLDNAFGNFRTLLGAITTNFAMAKFLTFLNNTKAGARGAMPDENYARELMQLFTIGIYQLNPDGTLVLDASGRPIETYTQSDVSQLARVFTGLSPATNEWRKPDRYRLPLVMDHRINERSPSTFLGTTVRGGGMGAINAALDAIFAHPNVPPFVSKSLIKRLVTSNPSREYVARVAAVFAGNETGVRGDLAAVVRAIFTDNEALNGPGVINDYQGKLRDPVQRFTNWARAFNATSPSGKWAVGSTTSPTYGLAQSPGRSPSVFNFFRPGYAPPDTRISQEGYVAPEFQITTEVSVIGYVNWMRTVVMLGAGDVTANYNDLLAVASDSSALVDEINLRLAAGQISASSRGIIKSAVETFSAATAGGLLNRVRTAVLLVLACPDYLAFA